MKIKSFEELDIWKLTLNITKHIYDLTSNNEFNTDFGLKDQIRRAIISVSSCIVEGFEKNNNNEFKRYLAIAKGSCGEVRNQLYIALAVKYISRTEFDLVNNLLLEEAAKIGKFITYLEQQKQQGNFIKTR
ncbi:four helix bundle protein [Candidatus Woesebacteria bacterium]|nr:four helix bundle protein [Candidatus Woesebacteria bacterium]